MNLSTADTVNEVYRVALQQSLTRKLKTEPEWTRFTTIARETAGRIDAEKSAFREDYQSRLSQARQIILREHSRTQLNLPPPGGTQSTPPSAEKLDILAMNRVQGDHERRITAIQRDEIDAYQMLDTDVRTREARQAHARETRSGELRDRFNMTNQISPHEAKLRARSGPSQS